MAHAGGRPLKFKTPEELQTKIDAYFDYCDKTIVKRVINKNNEILSETTKPYTITGLASFLGVDRLTLINYTERDEFFNTVKDAKAKIESEYEERALTGENNAPVSIFTLKNNFNWKDQTQTDLTTQGEKLSVNVLSFKKDNDDNNPA